LGAAARGTGGSPGAGILDALYGFFAPATAPRPADAIFVYAGQQERKEYAVSLWREGLAPTLLLSVGRFEWRRVAALGLPDDGGLLPLVASTPAPDRHFLVTLDPAGVRATLVTRGRFGTATETQALLDAVEAHAYRSVVVVSTAPHLRRIAILLRRLGRRSVGTRFDLVAVPDERTLLSRRRWWARPETRRILLGEIVKCLGSALLPRRLLAPPRPPLA
jgi:uncharacterized SAM-binding protein YcdF (DUF218 family)